MSHFTVLIIGENPEEQLEPFWELDLDGKEMMEDPRAEFVKEFAVEDLEKEFSKFKKKYKKEILIAKAKGKEDYWIKYKTCSAKEWIESWSGYYLNKEGTYYGFYTNPEAKWDWYVIGGRWRGLLKLKENRKGKMGEKSWTKEEEEDDENSCDQAKKGDIDFSIDEEKYKESIRFWELYVEGKKPKNKEEKEMIKGAFYNKKYYLERYKDKETYAKNSCEFSTFAVLKDGEWFEKGNMGWFGMHSAKPNEEKDWDEGFYEKFIKDLSEDTLLTIVDCHI